MRGTTSAGSEIESSRRCKPHQVDNHNCVLLEQWHHWGRTISICRHIPWNHDHVCDPGAFVLIISVPDGLTCNMTGHVTLFCRHIPRVYDFLWVAEDGMKMQGYNGSQLWDTSFAVQAITAAGLAEEFGDCLRKAHSYIDASQVSTQQHSTANPQYT